MVIKRALWIPLLALSIGGCSRDPAPKETAAPPPLALIKSGESPLWFELGPDGPVHIADPALSAQEPFAPWRLSRHIAGMAVSGKRLTMAVNRGGLLLMRPEETGGMENAIALYWAAEPSWKDYTVASLFVFQDTPLALLYRDDFFIDSGAPLPDPRVWRWDTAQTRLQGIALPAFADLPAAEGWDIEALSQGQDGRWYYRGVQKNRSPPETVYLSSGDPGQQAGVISPGLFRNAAIPYTINHIPEEFRVIFRAVEREEAKTPVAAVVSPEFPALRYYTGTSGGDIVELAGFYTQGSGDAGPRAAALFPDGRLLYGDDSGSPPVSYPLPPLPQGFAYTRLCLLGDVLLAAWEEQEAWSVGAAGFMVITGPWAW
ncbi:MAG: hypothetical protein LBD08_01135 [Treponema sp.]|jgi:hypothetical protein|nr:hypothetical protein [Treponema sp.]